MSVVKRLFRQFDEFAVDIQDWEIPQQGITVLWGPSGAGKSTIINSLLGLDDEAEVSWLWEGEDLGLLPPAHRNLGVVFQDLGLFPHLSTEDNILFPVDKEKHSHWQSDFDWLVKTLELEKLLASSVAQLSGGEKQRVAIARAMIYRPQMLLLDEPFASLDERLRERVRGMVREASQHLKCPVLLVTHDRSDVEQLAHRVCQIDRGLILKVSETL